MPNWTEEQLAAITDRRGTLLVSAAAGSGKTAVLVERAVGLMMDPEHPVSADRLLIVTFTRAAAEEMRARIAKRLAEEAAAHPHNAFLRRQRLMLGRANICTLDAYCMQLIRRYFAELSLPPDFTLADDASIYALRENALAAVLEEQYGSSADFRAFAALYGRARSDDRAARAVLALYDLSRSLPRSEQFLQNIPALYAGPTALPDTPWGKALLQQAAACIQNALHLLDAALALVEGEPALANYAPALVCDREFFSALLATVRAGQWDEAALSLQRYKPPALKAVRGYEGGNMDAVKELRVAAKKDLDRLRKDIFSCTEAEFEEDRRQIAPFAAALADAALSFGRRLFADKLEEKLLEYSDLEHLTLQLLCRSDGAKTPVAQAVSHGFDAVMVDEYQDTNELQAMIYRYLANDDASNLFFVGDVKQSIYRFRLADPSVFIAQRAAFERGEHGRVITLGKNFRSAQNIIDQINDIFSAVMSRRVGDVDYGAGERLAFGGGTPYDGGAMELSIVDLGQTDKTLGDALAVADTVEHLVKSGFPVRARTGGTRPCSYGDICILLRGRKSFPIYTAALAQRDIPAFADSNEAPLSSNDVSTLLSLLRVIDNPRQDIHLAAVLLSVMFSFTPDDLIRLRATHPTGNLYAALMHSEEKKAQSFCTALQALRRLSVSMPVAQLCDEIFARTHFFAAVGAMENGPARREALRAFTAWAASAGSGAHSLSSFLRLVDSALERKSAGSDSQPALAQNAVCLMTVHRSKGLEFPVVILADASHGFNQRDAGDPVLFHPALGLGLSLRAEGGLYSTAPHRAISLALRAETVSEEMRILYVALTRARDKLIVTVPLEDPLKTLRAAALRLLGTGGADAYTLGQAQSFADWLCTAALLHPDCGVLRRAIGMEELPLLKTSGHMRVEICVPQVPGGSARAPAFRRTAQPDAALQAQLAANFASRYPNAPLCALPAKMSVSEISHDSAPVTLARPAFAGRQRMTAAERGTAMHAVLQFMDLSRAQEDLSAELCRLADGAWIDPALIAQLDRTPLADFLKSPLADRMRTAQKLLREYAFFTAVPAKFLQADIPEAFAHTPVQVQGIADVVLINGETAEIADYKTDRGKAPADFVRAYQKQLLLYKEAVEKRLHVRVTRCTIYSLTLSREIDIPSDSSLEVPMP